MNPILLLIARPAIDYGAIEQFLSKEEAQWQRVAKATSPESLVEFAGRICYMSFGERQSPKDNSAYLRNLIINEHESVLEHAAWTFILSGISRAFSHQFVRHRIGFSFSQLSQQYVDHSSAQFVEPFKLDEQPILAEKWQAAIDSLKKAYDDIKSLLEEEGNLDALGSKKEINRFIRSAARSVLPNATETKLVFTANARALRHFLRVRGAIEGDVEMRKVCACLLSIMNAEAPSLFFDFSLEHLMDDSPIVRWQETSAHPVAIP